MAEQAKKGKKRTSFLTMLVIAILIALVGVQLIHLRSQIDDALTALQSDLDTAKQENDALASALEKADDPEFLQELARDQLGYVTPGEKTFYDVSN